MGPLMHIPFLILVPYSMVWLLEENKTSRNIKRNSHEANSILTAAKIHYGFVLYTTCITAVSTTLDSITFIKWTNANREEGVAKHAIRLSLVGRLCVKEIETTRWFSDGKG
jgi:hypothetical protein